MTTCSLPEQVEFVKAFIIKNYCCLSQNLEVKVVVPYLCEKGVLTINQAEEFLKRHIRDLLDKITRTDPILFIEFFSCVKEHYPSVLKNLVLPY